MGLGVNHEAAADLIVAVHLAALVLDVERLDLLAVVDHRVVPEQGPEGKEESCSTSWIMPVFSAVLNSLIVLRLQ